MAKKVVKKSSKKTAKAKAKGQPKPSKATKAAIDKLHSGPPGMA